MQIKHNAFTTINKSSDKKLKIYFIKIYFHLNLMHPKIHILIFYENYLIFVNNFSYAIQL